MTTIKGYLISRDGRELFLRELADWAVSDPEYEVTALVPMGKALVYDEFVVDGPEQEAPSLPNTDDTAERIQLMNELFDLQQQEIDQLKHSLEKFIEVVEGVVELTEVVSQSSVENRSKLLVISASCKEALKPND